MSVAKIIEISSESPTSFEDAIVQGIARASKTIHGIKSAWVKEQHVVVEQANAIEISQPPGGPRPQYCSQCICVKGFDVPPVARHPLQTEV